MSLKVVSTSSGSNTPFLYVKGFTTPASSIAAASFSDIAWLSSPA